MPIGTPPRLLILDNVKDEEGIQQWIPGPGGCRTLITARFPHWSPLVQGIHVYVLEPEPARALILSRSGLPDTEGNRAGADGLAEELGYLPLALEQAAAFIRKERISFERYLERYLRARAELLAEGSLGGTQYPDSVATTWRTTVERLGPLCLVILDFAAFLAPDSIPRSLLMDAQDGLQEALNERLADASSGPGSRTAINQDALDDALGDLSAYSMITLTEDAFSVHRLVQAVQADAMGEEVQRQWAERAVEAMYAAFPEFTPATWRVCERLLPHVDVCAGHIEKHGFVSRETAWLTLEVGDFLQATGDLSRAMAYYEQSHGIREKLARQEPDNAQ